MNRYGPKARKVIEETLHEYKQGKLQSGQSKKRVTSKDQALAIGIEKARNLHYKVPQK